MVTSDSLTVLLPPSRLQAHADDDQQKEPECGHKMPVNDHTIHQVSPDWVAKKQLCKQIDQNRNSADDMQSMDTGEHIKKRAVGICGQVKPLSGELPPCQVLPANKSQS